ncbi:SigB/SigF/SigG family RNA polymerase sigma factor [Nocardia inohanensis]|uniref:SigB/SigF/SigG family RNA polymerase sigma factor n=1 Tax=Nocardia inohanensis TaxID=209246 RepID=UPI0008318F10|nr:SigB/SigF/SigG family RNA polymerase sigma factor [Nocardia inohanensis]
MSHENAAVSGSTERRRGGDSYDNIEPWLDKLAALEAGSAEHTRLRAEVIGKCMPLGAHIARRYAGRGVEFEDLNQIAAVGVVLAVDRFDPGNGATFLAYAIPTIMGEVKRYFRDSTWAVRVPRRLKELQQRLTTVIPDMSQQLGRQPTARELSEATGAELTEITQALIAANSYTTESLDTRAAFDDEADKPLAPVDGLAVEDPGYDLMEESIIAGPLLADLPPRDRAILVMRYGQDKTQTEIAAVLGISQMQISRILARILRDLRERAGSAPITAGCRNRRPSPRPRAAARRSAIR